MPLPVGGAGESWPPADCAHLYEETRAWRAWWSGDLAELAATAGADVDPMLHVRNPVDQRKFNMPSQLIRRRFWQRRATTLDKTVGTRPVHAPLAADIAVTSADLLFGEIPDLAIPKPTTKAGKPKVDKNRDAIHERLEQLIEQVQLWSRLLEGAEACSATGGVYLRAVWDDTVADHPLLTIVDQVHAVPDFRFGRLAAVTFWEVIHREGSVVVRHLERHEPGAILHGVYEGTETALGETVDLSQYPATARFRPVMVPPAGLPYPLMVEYVPNVLPNRRHLVPVGRSDYAGAEGQLDLLDEVWTSLARDVRLAQARVVAPLEYLTPAGTKVSDGKTLDLDTELFTGFNVADMDKLAKPFELIQPDLRVAEHAEAVTGIVRSIVGAAGYSPQTFGLDVEGAAETGVAERIKLKKTLHTLTRKRGYWTPAVTRIVETLLALDAALFGGPGSATPDLDWPEITDDPVDRANTTLLWRQADAMSMESAIREREPRWDDDQVAEELEKIESETKAMSPQFAAVDVQQQALDKADQQGAAEPGKPAGAPMRKQPPKPPSQASQVK